MTDYERIEQPKEDALNDVPYSRFWSLHDFSPEELWESWDAGLCADEIAEKLDTQTAAVKMGLPMLGLGLQRIPEEGDQYLNSGGWGRQLRKEREQNLAQVQVNGGYEVLHAPDWGESHNGYHRRGVESEGTHRKTLSHHRLLAYAWRKLDSPFRTEDGREVHHEIPAGEQTSCKWLNFEDLLTVVTRDEHREIDPELRTSTRGQSRTRQFGDWTIKSEGRLDRTHHVKHTSGQSWKIGSGRRANGEVFTRAQICCRVLDRVDAGPAFMQEEFNRGDGSFSLDAIPTRILQGGLTWIVGYLAGVRGLETEEIADYAGDRTEVEDRKRRLGGE
jgi:hypothetical protein